MSLYRASILKNKSTKTIGSVIPWVATPTSVKTISESTLVKHSNKRIVFAEQSEIKIYHVPGFAPTEFSKNERTVTRKELSNDEINYTVPMSVRDVRVNFKEVLTRIVKSSPNIELKSKVDQLEDIYLDGSCLYVDKLTKEWVFFWEYLSLYVSDLATGVANPERVLYCDNDSITDENEKEVQDSDYTILRRDQAHHSTIHYIRSLLFSIGHFPGSDSHFDDIVMRSARLRHQLSWYMKTVLFL